MTTGYNATRRAVRWCQPRLVMAGCTRETSQNRAKNLHYNSAGWNIRDLIIRGLC